MSDFPVDVKAYRVIRKSKAYDHIFCAGCGREITRFNLKTGELIQRQHFLCETELGIQLRFCWRRDNCEQRREERRRRRVSKTVLERNP